MTTCNMLTVKTVRAQLETGAAFCNNFSDIEFIDRVNDISYESFFLDYLVKNKPCVLSASTTQRWKSRLDWVTANGEPNLKFLQDNFGSAIVPVAYCDEKEYNSQRKENMTFKDYIHHWENVKHGKDDLPCWYLKDWHFARNFQMYKAYETPDCCTSDWLNEFCKVEDDDYQFVYMGPKGTWTPLHADVFGSYSWSANVCGRKKWLLFPPGTEKQLVDSTNKMAYSVTDVISSCDVHLLGLEVIQEAGEVIFVPSGWHHQVWNLDDVISINHNWFNGCNILYVWECLCMAAQNVENEISDCKDVEGWEDQCQVILKIHHGMNYAGFLKLLKFISEARLTDLTEKTTLDKWHRVYDLIQVKKVISKMTKTLNVPTIIASEAKDLYSKLNFFLLSVKELKLENC